MDILCCSPGLLLSDLVFVSLKCWYKIELAQNFAPEKQLSRERRKVLFRNCDLVYWLTSTFLILFLLSRWSLTYAQHLNIIKEIWKPFYVHVTDFSRWLELILYLKWFITQWSEYYVTRDLRLVRRIPVWVSSLRIAEEDDCRVESGLLRCSFYSRELETLKFNSNFYYSS